MGLSLPRVPQSAVFQHMPHDQKHDLLRADLPSPADPLVQDALSSFPAWRLMRWGAERGYRH